MTFRVVVTMPSWKFGGVTFFTAHLVRGLLSRGIEARVIITDPERNLIPPPLDIPVSQFSWTNEGGWRYRLRAMIRYLERQAPAVLLPNYDFLYACVGPGLSGRVAVIGHIHEDDPVYYEPFGALGHSWNAAVVGGSYLAEKAALLYPHLAERLCLIPYGVWFPSQPPKRERRASDPLRMLYAGRLIQGKKRVFDLPKIVNALVERGVRVQLDVTGTGPQADELKQMCSNLVEHGVIRFLGVVPEEQLRSVFAENDVLLLTSDNEGKPLTLVEAMGSACVPVVTDIPSGIPELIEHEVNGFIVPVGDIEAFAERVAWLARNDSCRTRMGLKAYETVVRGGFHVDDMVTAYMDLFQRVLGEMERGTFQRPVGPLRLLPSLGPEGPVSWKDRLPVPLRALACRWKRALHQ